MKRDIFKIKISEYEQAIIDGCCYPPSINSKNNLRLDWEDPKLKIIISIFKSNKFKIDQIKAKHNIPNQKILFVRAKFFQ